jgi:hypothetical protein
MKITQLEFKGTTPATKDIVEVAVNETITLETSSGRFNIAERLDGSLEVTETGHSRLAVLPQVSNGIVLRAERF